MSFSSIEMIKTWNTKKGKFYKLAVDRQFRFFKKNNGEKDFIEFIYKNTKTFETLELGKVKDTEINEFLHFQEDTFGKKVFDELDY